MRFSVPLAGWVLAATSFIAGTIVPVIYSRISYEGVSIKQPFEFTGFHHRKGENRILFTTILKFANASNSPVLVDDIILNPSRISGFDFYIKQISIHKLDPTDPSNWAFPLEGIGGIVIDYLPIIINKSEEEQMVVEFMITSDSIKDNGYELMEQYVRENGLFIDIKMNGKFRNYILEAR